MPPPDSTFELSLSFPVREHKIAEVGRHLGVRVRTRVLLGDHAEQTIVELTEMYDTDLVVLNAHARPVSERAFLGHRTDHVLRYAPCPVVLVGKG